MCLLYILDLSKDLENQKVLNSSEVGTETKPRSLNLEKQELKPKPRIKPVSSGQNSRVQPQTSLFSKSFVKCKI